jgi:hypothetical protein
MKGSWETGLVVTLGTWIVSSAFYDILEHICVLRKSFCK